MLRGGLCAVVPRTLVPGPVAGAMSDSSELRLPVIEEEVVVAKRAGPIEHVRVHTTVETHNEIISGTLDVEAIEVERRRVERPVDAAPAPRQEDDVTIVSVVEERAIVTTQLVVVEEILLRRRVTPTPFTVPVPVRRTRVDVARTTDPSRQQEEQ